MIGTWLLWMIVAAVIGQVLRELLALAAAGLGPRLISRAANRLPKDRREIRREEWLAEYGFVKEQGGVFAPMRFCIGTLVGAVRIGRREVPDGSGTSHQFGRWWKSIGHSITETVQKLRRQPGLGKLIALCMRD
jgi:hypothetical protein